MLKRTIAFVIILFAVTPCLNTAFAQPTWTFEPFGKEKKSEQFEERKLGSEKTADKKFTFSRHFLQNNITHYNYYFNANNKVNNVVARAKIGNRDDYSRLLSFYPYSLDATAAQKIDLDSVIYTCTAGILLHDLRNDWVDNMYLLIGKSYFYKKDFDSAVLTFQFINYNLFPRKKKDDDYDKVIGTNDAASGSFISIADKEKRNLPQRVFTLPPSRNDALIWLVRGLIEQNELGEAAGLINTLQNDPNLPNRLRNDLEEVNAYWYFKQSGYDSAAAHLEKGLTNADTKQDRARWEFLLAQLYEMGGKYDKANLYYDKASKHTVDPVMDIYAQLNQAKMYKGNGDIKELNSSIDNLLKMGRKDKFDVYRDIIYYSAGQLTLQKPDTNSAVTLFHRSLKYNENNIPFKNKAYLQLGDIAYGRHQYRIAAAMYDSLQMNDSTLSDRMRDLTLRKAALAKIVDNITKVETEDSLQRIAAMPAAERELFVKRMLKKLRKDNGLKEEANTTYAQASSPFNTTKPADLFDNSSTKGDWYFYNSGLKSKGFNDFKSVWGNRANVDNWRRKAAIDLGAANVPNVHSKLNSNGTNTPVDSTRLLSQELSFDGMMGKLPLTAEKVKTSNDVIASSLLELAKVYQSELEDYPQAAATYEEYLRRFPTQLADGEVYLGLYFCYTKMGDKAKADYYKGLLSKNFAGSKAATLANNGQVFNPTSRTGEATKVYENIYNLFLEGKFDQAVADKKAADAKYGVNYWTPQLLYIEAIYNIRQQNDSLAIVGLNTIIKNNPKSPLKDKAATMIDVLKRRKEIEKYLTDLQVTRIPEDQVLIVDSGKAVVKTPVVTTPVAVTPPPVVKPKPVVVPADTVKKVAPPLVNGQFKMALASPHYVIMILDKVDPVYVNEAKNAFTRYNKEEYYGQPIDIAKDAIDADRNILVISPFADADAALKYYDKIKKDARSEVSWLPATKYSFLIITDENLQLLKTNKKLADYKTLLNTQYPNRF